MKIDPLNSLLASLEADPAGPRNCYEDCFQIKRAFEGFIWARISQEFNGAIDAKYFNAVMQQKTTSFLTFLQN